ncbi:MAG TPA: HisA/HisF-related TIM barrel protein, partial [Pyrinomonadaceae bacterium]|nr:HisA/HisF-related TIM barrel protein [Pyrinomonadaceae bacterium]
IDAWRTETREPILSYLRKYAERGVTKAFVTDIVSDGTMEGPSIKLYKKILGAVQEIDLIASGGVRSIDDIDELEKIGCAGVIIGRALYEQTIKLEDLAKYVG